jgi:ParB family transcriptional regulator, chromosome partitioning protein
MKRSNQQLHIQSISLDKLKKSDENVRKVPHTPADIKALANSIDAHGQFQNLVVKTEQDEQGEATGFYLVTAGEGRRLAQLLRVKRKQIKADHSIPCIIDDTHTASAVSLAENDLRRNMIGYVADLSSISCDFYSLSLRESQYFSSAACTVNA